MPYPVFQAGMRVRAHHLRALQWTEVFQVDTRTIASLTGMQNTDLQVPALAGARYRYVLLASITSTPAMKFNWETPVGGAVDRFQIGPGSAATGGSGAVTEVSLRSESAATEITADGATNTHYREEGDITGGDSTGTFIFQFAQQTSTASNTSFNAGSRLWYIRVD